MSDVRQFSVLGRDIDVKDTFARAKFDELNKEAFLTECVWLGDSFTTGFQFGGTYIEYSIPSIVSDKLKLNIHNYGVNAAGYVTSGDGGSTFMTQAVNAVNDNTLDRAKVKYVFILGGINDQNNVNVNAAMVNTASVALVNYLDQNFPYAEIIAIPNWAAFDLGANIEKFLAIGSIDTGNFRRPYRFLKDNLISLIGFAEYINQDNIHPNQQGAAHMAECIYSLINGCTPNIHRNITITPASASWDLANLAITEDFYGYTIEGLAHYVNNIDGTNLQICSLDKHFAFLFDKYITAISQSGLGVASIKIVPSVAGASGEGQVGGIYVVNDLGYNLIADHNIVFNVRIDKSNFIH